MGAYGVFISHKRPKSKREIKDALLFNPDKVYFENTSMFGREEWSGYATDEGFHDLSFVGPDPFTKRSFFGSVSKKNDKFVVK